MSDEDSLREEILKEAMDELSALRRVVSECPDHERAIEAIDFYESELPKITSLPRLLELWGRAVADVRHEVAVVEFGEESPEAEAVFDEEDREFSKLYRWIWGLNLSSSNAA